ncbi:Zinc finger, C3HC4 type (RING finger) [Popillia japonica]|uniref:Zinc finger, C3HC4 type (RING finger) n=1 Tax=Popillia japonica TaxID=7064 RepID=A0AAW1L9X9_POPJA
MVLQIGLALVIGIGVGILLYELAHQNPQQTQSQTPRIMNCGVPPRLQNRTTTKAIWRRKPKKEEETEELCIFCADPIIDGKTISCNHRFHRYCINKWFETSVTTRCPYRCLRQIGFYVDITVDVGTLHTYITQTTFQCIFSRTYQALGRKMFMPSDVCDIEYYIRTGYWNNPKKIGIYLYLSPKTLIYSGFFAVGIIGLLYSWKCNSSYMDIQTYDKKRKSQKKDRAIGLWYKGPVQCKLCNETSLDIKVMTAELMYYYHLQKQSIITKILISHAIHMEYCKLRDSTGNFQIFPKNNFCNSKGNSQKLFEHELNSFNKNKKKFFRLKWQVPQAILL